MKIQEALSLYGRGLISIGRATEIAGLSREDIVRQAQAFGIHPSWSEEMAREELA